MSRLEAVRSLVEQDPSNSRVRYMLCMEYLSGARWAEAVAELKELLARDPDYVAAYYQGGRACEQMDDAAQARAFYQDGITAARRTGDAHALSELQAALDILGA